MIPVYLHVLLLLTVTKTLLVMFTRFIVALSHSLCQWVELCRLDSDMHESDMQHGDAEGKPQHIEERDTGHVFGNTLRLLHEGGETRVSSQ